MTIEITNRRVCCVSDIHVGVHQNSSMWHDITLKWAGWLRDSLKSTGVSDIIIPGDLFHYRDEIAVNTIHVVADLLDIWKDFNIVLLVGNHDAFYKDKSDINSLSILNGRRNVHVISTPKQIRYLGRKLMFCPWGTSLDQIKPSDIVFGHFEIMTFKYNQHKICESGMKSDGLISKSPLIITGHFHLREERKYDSGTVLYVGNPFQMDFGDAGSTKGYYILDLKTSEYEFFENTISPKHHKIKLSELANYGNITPEVENLFHNNILKLVIDKTISPDDMDVLIRRLTELNSISLTVDYDVNFNKFGLDEENESDLSSVDIPTAIEEFINMLEDVPNKQEIIDYTVELYNSSK